MVAQGNETRKLRNNLRSSVLESEGLFTRLGLSQLVHTFHKLETLKSAKNIYEVKVPNSKFQINKSELFEPRFSSVGVETPRRNPNLLPLVDLEDTSKKEQ
jgi:hypothetical protein